MIGFGLRLALRGGAESAARLIITAAAVALGTGMLLITVAGFNAVNTQNLRYAWLDTGPAAAARGAAASTSTAEPVWWLLRADYFGGQVIGTIDVAGTGPRSPVPPGIPHLPGPDQFYASPALTALLRATPADQLRDRFPGRQIGVIGTAALPAPDSLLIVIGQTPGQLSRAPGAARVTRIQVIPPSGCNGNNCLLNVGINADGIDLILSVIVVGLLFPVLIFIATATRLAAARREQRFAAMRLAGATPAQVGVIAAVESTVAAVAGMAAGFGLFFLLRTPLAGFSFTGAPFFPADLSLSAADIAVVAVGVPVAAAVSARLALRRLALSPLGISRRVTPLPPRARRLIPLLAGIAELVAFIGIGRPGNTVDQIAAFAPGFLLIMVGLMIAGPWLTMVGARMMARQTGTLATLIASRRLADNPQAAFRAVSGLVLALFVVSVTTGVITTIAQDRDAPTGGTAAQHALIAQVYNPHSGGAAPAAAPAVVPALARLRAVSGVTGLAVVRANPLPIVIPDATLGLPTEFGRVPEGLVSCTQLASTPMLGRCPAGARYAVIPSQITPTYRHVQARAVWPAADISAGRVARLPVEAVVAATDGSAATIERARTLLEATFPYRDSPATISENLQQTLNAHELTEWRQLATVIIGVSLPIAGCTLAVSVVAGLTDRKRPFSLLRLTGVPLRLLRHVVALESAVPLLLVAAVSIGAGLLAAQLFLRAQLHYWLRSPGTGYYLIVAVGLAASLAIIYSTLPLLSRITGPETARNE